jgi:hypothetical protein
MNQKCPICGDKTSRPITAALDHFRPYESGQWRWLRGNIKTFGFWSGLRGTLCLVSPALNTILNWKYRHSRLEIPDGVQEADRA